MKTRKTHELQFAPKRDTLAQREYYVRHKERKLQYQREYRARNAEREKAKAKEYRSSGRPEELRKMRLYGLTEDDYQAMRLKQAGLCAICDEPMKRPHIDHDHSTGRVRALLCSNCNRGLGHFHDNIDKLLAACSYLKEHS